MNMPTPFTLPTVNFVGGSYQTLTFRTFADNKNFPYDIRNGDAYFSVRSYTHPDSDPVILNRRMNEGTIIATNGEIKEAYLSVSLSTEDTVELQGKYIYQIAITDSSGNQEIAQGIIFIFPNIAPGKSDT